MPLHLRGLVGGLLVACAGDLQVPDLDPDLQLGTGVDAFVALDDGDEVEVVFGPQGGYHVDGSLRVQGIDPGDEDDLGDPRNPLTVFQVRREDGAIVSGLQGAEAIEFRQGIRTAEMPGTYEMVGRRILLDIRSDAELEGQTLTISVSVEDANGVDLYDERAVTAVASPYND